MVRNLSVVDENTPKPKPKSLTDSIERGSRRDEIVALRVIVGKAIENPKTPAPALAALARQLVLLGKELESLDAAESRNDIADASEVRDETWDPSDIPARREHD